MGNCQAVDAAALVIQHPNGKLERMYWPVTASDVMKANPGHYVSLIIPLQQVASSAGNENEKSTTAAVRFTRVKLLRPSDTLVLGRAYRLVTTQEVMKVLRAKKQAKMRRDKPESSAADVQININSNNNYNQEQENMVSEFQTGGRHRHNNLGNGKAKSWRPSLQSISENNSGHS